MPILSHESRIVRWAKNSGFAPILRPVWIMHSNARYKRAVGDLAKRSGVIRPAIDRMIEKHEAHIVYPMSLSNMVTSQEYRELSLSYRNPDIFLPVMAFIYDITRTLQPSTIVETGVERGASTYTFLRALEKNGNGQLHSIDLLPPIHRRLKLPIAPCVPIELRKRWHYYEGNSREILPGLLRELGQVDLFMHGSDHSYEVQSFEVRCAWPHIKKPRICIVDRPDYPTNNYRTWAECIRDFKPRQTVLLPEGDSTMSNMFGVIIE